jgi:hypothetical protein
MVDAFTRGAFLPVGHVLGVCLGLIVCLLCLPPALRRRKSGEDRDDLPPA